MGIKIDFHGVVLSSKSTFANEPVYSEECLKKMAKQDERLEFKDGELIFHGEIECPEEFDDGIDESTSISFVEEEQHE